MLQHVAARSGWPSLKPRQPRAAEFDAITDRENVYMYFESTNAPAETELVDVPSRSMAVLFVAAMLCWQDSGGRAGIMPGGQLQLDELKM